GARGGGEGMTMDDERETDTRFDEAFRAWAARPPARPASAAAREIRGRLTARPGTARPLLGGWAWATAGVLVVAAGLGGLLRFGGSGPGAEAPPAASATLPAAAPLGDGEVLIWLDAETPLFMTFAPPPGGRSAGGGT
ncbi:MAG TPA: hypothetical protein VLA75_05305, partial [Thermoanaerobaculia bacterium]|nr:hypothetical protein [Thermoanaerobaculia bacterium]